MATRSKAHGEDFEEASQVRAGERESAEPSLSTPPSLFEDREILRGCARASMRFALCPCWC